MSLDRNLSLRQRTKSALDRIETLEQSFVGVVNATNQMFGQVGQRLDAAEEILNAIVEVVGKSEVEKVIETTRKAVVEAQSERAKAALADAVTKGSVVKADAVTTESLVVGLERAKVKEGEELGEIMHPGRVQLTYSNIKPEFQEKILGQGVGFKVETPIGGTFEVIEIYNILPKKEDPETEEVIAPAPDATAPTGEAL